MSIIHEALKKAQRGLAANTVETLETIPLTAKPDSLKKNKISPIISLCLAVLIIAAAGLYIYKQFQDQIPRAQLMAQKTIYKLIHKEDLPDFKAKAPEDLKPLAQITINPPPKPAGTKNIAAAAPITLNIHGIMSNATGNLALINDQVYQEGDSVGGAKIVKINLDSITVIINGAQETIHVKG